MVLLVIILHCSPMLLPGRGGTPVPPLWSVLLVDLCRCAVPFFFIASGYFLNLERPTPEVAMRAGTRIMGVYLFWTLAYVVIEFVARGNRPALTPELLLGGGAAFHLWFLPALAGGQVLVSFLMRRWGMGTTVAAVLALYAAGPMLYAYQGLFGFEYHWRLVPFVRHLAAPAFVLLGIALRRAPDLRAPIALALAALALVLVAAEETVLNLALGEPRVSRDFLWSTLVYGTCAFLLVKSCRGLERLAPLGQITLGIYAVHLAFVWLFRDFISTATPPGLALVVALTAMSSAACIALMRKWQPLARFVR